MSRSTVQSRTDVAARPAGALRKSSRRPAARYRPCGYLAPAGAKRSGSCCRGGNETRRKASDVQLRKCPRDVGENPWPSGRGRRAEKLDCRCELTVSTVDRRIVLVRPMDKKGCGEDQVTCDDRGDHQRCDLCADALQIQKTEQLQI